MFEQWDHYICNICTTTKVGFVHNVSWGCQQPVSPSSDWRLFIFLPEKVGGSYKKEVLSPSFPQRYDQEQEQKDWDQDKTLLCVFHGVGGRSKVVVGVGGGELGRGS